MTSYIHHIPGRLRIRSGAIRRSEPRAAAVKALLEEQPGVRSVQPNTLTGSIVVHYDPAVTDGGAVMSVLRERGYLNPVPPTPAFSAVRGARAPQAAVAEEIAKKVAASLVQTAVERSLLALVAAML